ncbi:hypothetical protein V4Y02_23760, partial [Escherichia coli]
CILPKFKTFSHQKMSMDKVNKQEAPDPVIAFTVEANGKRAEHKIYKEFLQILEEKPKAVTKNK